MTGLPLLLLAAIAGGWVWLLARYETALARTRADHDRKEPL